MKTNYSFSKFSPSIVGGKFYNVSQPEPSKPMPQFHHLNEDNCHKHFLSHHCKEESKEECKEEHHECIEEEVALEDEEPIFECPCNSPMQSIISRVDDVPNVELVIEELSGEPELHHADSMPVIEIHHVYREEDSQTVRSQVNPMYLNNIGQKKIQMKDLVSMVIAKSRIRKYEENYGWH